MWRQVIRVCDKCGREIESGNYCSSCTPNELWDLVCALLAFGVGVILFFAIQISKVRDKRIRYAIVLGLAISFTFILSRLVSLANNATPSGIANSQHRQPLLIQPAADTNNSPPIDIHYSAATDTTQKEQANNSQPAPASGTTSSAKISASSQDTSLSPESEQMPIWATQAEQQICAPHSGDSFVAAATRKSCCMKTLFQNSCINMARYYEQGLAGLQIDPSLAKQFTDFASTRNAAIVSSTAISSGTTSPIPDTTSPAVAPLSYTTSSVSDLQALSQPSPEYPPAAMAANVSGTVVLHAVISTDGIVQNLEVVSGPSLLQQAAIDAVTKWRYKPRVVQGHPVGVDTTIKVNFGFGK